MMNYFTPQLFVRLQNLRDEAAIQEWDRAVAAYAASLKEVSGQFPKSLRDFVRKTALHDADILSMTRMRDDLSITVQTEPPEAELYILTYTLTEPPRINRTALPRDYCTDHIAWLYDELALAEPIAGPSSWLSARDRARGTEKIPVYTHDILLSNGWEVSLTFRKFKLARPEALLPPASAGDEHQKETLTRSA